MRQGSLNAAFPQPSETDQPSSAAKPAVIAPIGLSPGGGEVSVGLGSAGGEVSDGDGSVDVGSGDGGDGGGASEGEGAGLGGVGDGGPAVGTGCGDGETFAGRSDDDAAGPPDAPGAADAATPGVKLAKSLPSGLCGWKSEPGAGVG
jgi:hypothetical protein